MPPRLTLSGEVDNLVRKEKFEELGMAYERAAAPAEPLAEAPALDVGGDCVDLLARFGQGLRLEEDAVLKQHNLRLRVVGGDAESALGEGLVDQIKVGHLSSP